MPGTARLSSRMDTVVRCSRRGCFRAPFHRAAGDPPRLGGGDRDWPRTRPRTARRRHGGRQPGRRRAGGPQGDPGRGRCPLACVSDRPGHPLPDGIALFRGRAASRRPDGGVREQRRPCDARSQAGLDEWPLGAGSLRGRAHRRHRPGLHGARFGKWRSHRPIRRRANHHGSGAPLARFRRLAGDGRRVGAAPAPADPRATRRTHRPRSAIGSTRSRSRPATLRRWSTNCST